MRTNWKSKLTSRKFWAAVVGFLTALLAAFHMDEMTIQQVTALVTAGGVLVAYILGEGMVDKARIKTDSNPRSHLPLKRRHLIKPPVNRIKSQKRGNNAWHFLPRIRVGKNTG